MPRRRCLFVTTSRATRDREPHLAGAVAQLVERMHGMHEVRGSIPLSSTVHSGRLRAERNRFFCETAGLVRARGQKIVELWAGWMLAAFA